VAVLIVVSSCPIGGAAVPPLTPAGLRVANLGTRTLAVLWNPSRAAASYQAYRDPAPDGLFSLQVYDDTAIGFADIDLEPRTTYYYRVRATNATGSSDLSAAVSRATFAETLDPCDSLNGWGSNNALSLDTMEKREGSASVMSIGSAAEEFRKTFEPFDTGLSAADAYLQFWYFVSDTSALEDDNQVELGSGGIMDSGEYNWSLKDLGNGWNFISLRITDAAATGGAGDLHAINWFRVYRHKKANVTTRIDDLRLVGTASAGPPRRRLAVSTSGTGSGSVVSDPPGIDCGGNCSALFEDGAIVTLSALPAGSAFEGWSGAFTGTASTSQVVMSGDRSVNAEFAEKPGLNLTIGAVYVTQAIQTPDGSVPLVSAREGLVRIFVLANHPDQANTPAPKVRVRFYRGGTLVEAETLAASGGSVPISFVESHLSSSWNLRVPADLLTPGLSMLADVDPDGVVAESVETDNAWPLSGQPHPLDIRELPPFVGRLVPVHQSAFGTTGDVSDSTKDSYLDLFRRIYPVGRDDVDVREPYTTAAVTANGETDWLRLIGEMRQLRIDDNSPRYYYGVAVGRGRETAGLGYIGYPVAVGYDQSDDRGHVFAHELGHNFGRFHAPCGGPIDEDYPYPSGYIGGWGWDRASGTLVPPSAADVMGYCRPAWVSDYTYRGILGYRENEAVLTVVPAADDRPMLALWGRAGSRGAVIEPAYVVSSGTPIEPRPGPYRLDGVDDEGAVLFSRTFTGEAVSEGLPDERHFSFRIPVSEARVAQLAVLRVTGGGVATELRSASGTAEARALALRRGVEQLRPQSVGPDRVRLRWDHRRFPLVVVKDPQTGAILSFARGGDATVITMRSQLELELSDGVRSTARTMRVEGR
jgi:hypothetical protein